MTPENWLCGVAAITAAGMRFVLSSAAMSAQQSSFGHNGVPWHMLAPIMPVRDKNDLQRREENFRSSITACPSCWRNYFEVLATQLHREMN